MIYGQWRLLVEKCVVFGKMGVECGWKRLTRVVEHVLDARPTHKASPARAQRLCEMHWARARWPSGMREAR